MKFTTDLDGVPVSHLLRQREQFMVLYHFKLPDTTRAGITLVARQTIGLHNAGENREDLTSLGEEP